MMLATDVDVNELREELVATLSDVVGFVKTDRFQALVNELRRIPTSSLRRQFVRDVIINKKKLAKRGILVPEGLIIQRSAFGDRRPTLFCVTKFLKNRKWKA